MVGQWQEVLQALTSISDTSTTLLNHPTFVPNNSTFVPNDSTFVPDNSTLVPNTPSQPLATSDEWFPRPDPLSG